jgi:pimeloyl-ACP methyl ester carboxylesterase
VVPRVTAVAIAAILLLSACTFSTPQQGKSRSGTTQSPTPAARGSVAWTDCGGSFQCGSVRVPLDYAHPAAGTIDIAINRMAATDQTNRIGSLLVNPGGPGASGIQFLRDDVSALKVLNQRFDLIGFDPRGVGQSSPVRCLDATQEAAYEALDSVLDDPQEKQALFESYKQFAAGCEQLSGTILPFVDTVSAVRDMDAIRAALGDAKLTFLGYSYGTFMGETYAHLFPMHVRAIVLDGVVDPKLSAMDSQLAQTAGFEQDLQAFLADCPARPSCTWAQPGGPDARLTALMQRIDATPMPVGNRTLTRALALTAVAEAMYDTSSWKALDQALALAERGSGGVLLAIADFYYGQLNFDAFTVISCLDRPTPTDVAAYDALGPAFVKASPLFGPADQYGGIQCADMPVKATGQPGPLTADGAPPILIVGATGDPATPYSGAVSVHQQLAGSVLLTRQGNGHTSGNDQCSTAAENDYLINLKVPADGTICP